MKIDENWTFILFFQKIYGTAAQRSCCQWFPKKEKSISTKQNVFFGQYWKNQYLKHRHNSSKERVKKKSAKVSLGRGQSSFEKSHCYASNRICLKLVLKSYFLYCRLRMFLSIVVHAVVLERNGKAVQGFATKKSLFL